MEASPAMLVKLPRAAVPGTCTRSVTGAEVGADVLPPLLPSSQVNTPALGVATTADRPSAASAMPVMGCAPAAATMLVSCTHVAPPSLE